MCEPKFVYPSIDKEVLDAVHFSSLAATFPPVIVDFLDDFQI
jgi:hypothetical protein